jgi:hypothetical protein
VLAWPSAVLGSIAEAAATNTSKNVRLKRYYLLDHGGSFGDPSLYRFVSTWTVTEKKEYVNGTCAGCLYSPSCLEEVFSETRR